MTDAKQPQERRRPTPLDVEEVAAILAYAKLHGLEKASEKFNLSERSITRWRAKVRDGKAPELAALVAKQAAVAAERRGDVICEALDELLVELRQRKTKLSNSELIDAVDKVGGLRVTAEALSGGAGLRAPSDGKPTREDQQGSGAPAGAGPDPGGAVPAARGAGSPGSEPGAVRVH